MKLINNFLFYTLLILFLPSCSQSPAEVEYRIGKHRVSDEKIQPPSAVTEEKLSPIPSLYEKGVVIVRDGETIRTIAVDHNVLVEDLVSINNLQKPYNLSTGQKLILPSYKIHNYLDNTETVYDISEKYNVHPELIIELNHLSYPYTLTVGQQLRIPLTRENSSDPNNTAILSGLPTIQPDEKLELSVKDGSSTNKPSAKVDDKNLELKFSRNDKKVNIISPDNSGFTWPIRGKIISSFASQTNGIKNDGIRIGGTAGEEVKASKAGKVYYAGDEIKGLGNVVIIIHSDKIVTAYGYLDEIKVKKNQQVTANTIIGTVGTTGEFSDPQLYFSMRKAGKIPVNPLTFLPKTAN